MSVSFAQGGGVSLTYDPASGVITGATTVAPPAQGAWSGSDSLRIGVLGWVDSERYSVGTKTLDRGYVHDLAGRLTRSSDTDGLHEYSYDDTGLMLTLTAGSETRLVGGGDGLLRPDSAQFTLDPYGRIGSTRGLTFSYGPDGLLASARRDAATWNYEYTAEGERLLKFNGAAPSVAYLEEGIVDAAGLHRIIRFGGRPAGILRGGVFTAIPTDSRGNVLGEPNGTARIASPYGERFTPTSVAAILDYASKGLDTDLGLIRMGVRDYDPRLGVFTTPDPLVTASPETCVEDPRACSIYAYAHGDPTRYTDPSGLLPPDPPIFMQARWICEARDGCSEREYLQIEREMGAATLKLVGTQLGMMALGIAAPEVAAAVAIYSLSTNIYDAVQAYRRGDNGKAALHGFFAALDAASLLLPAISNLKSPAPASRLTLLGQPGIETPYGVAVQADTAAAAAARAQVEQGATFYRIGTMGRSAAGEGQFWALEHPLSPGFGQRYGIPPENIANASFIEAATVKPGIPFITRPAPGFGPNLGGGIEVVVPAGGVELQSFSAGGGW